MTPEAGVINYGGNPDLSSFDACMTILSTRGRRSKSANGRNRDRRDDYGGGGSTLTVIDALPVAALSVRHPAQRAILGRLSPSRRSILFLYTDVTVCGHGRNWHLSTAPTSTVSSGIRDLPGASMQRPHLMRWKAQSRLIIDNAPHRSDVAVVARQPLPVTMPRLRS